MDEALVSVRGLQKSFGGIAALRDGQFDLHAGSVHALCGGNGAGKSTFLNILMGIHRRDAGTILRAGHPVAFAGPAEALAAGISIIEQELSPVPAMSVAENIYLGREPLAPFGRIDFRAMNRASQALLDSFGFAIRATDPMMDLTVAQTQLVEIAKALSHDAEVIIMDEPTSALGEAEADQLFAAIRTLRARGKGVIYVSHRLSEIFEIADRYTVFRDGAFVETGAMADMTRERLIHAIVGRPLAEEYVKNNGQAGDVVLEARGIDAANGVRNVSFALRRGEILALYGLMGSGRTEIFERLFGLGGHVAGEVAIEGRTARIARPQDAIDAGLALVTEDRKGSGLVLTQDVRENICLASLGRLGTAAVMSPRKERGAARAMMAMFGIKAADDTAPVASLSGGNQQKVVLGKWFLTEPRILLLDEPTRGVDVGAKREIYAIMSDFAARGGGVMMISSETEEVLGMADRVIVMRDRRVAGELARSEMSAQALLDLAV